MVNELTSGSDLWARVQAGTKIVMRVITEEVVTSFSERYQCPCGTWNDLKLSTTNILAVSKHGYYITWSAFKAKYLIRNFVAKQVVCGKLNHSVTAPDSGINNAAPQLQEATGNCTMQMWTYLQLSSI
ncbi:hypothetical protein EDD15DRAFT_2194849 [Pisolithus albus]|nr:hypothetical protein EDD15DRAFT_2194849 [Pisolithus albus]